MTTCIENNYLFRQSVVLTHQEAAPPATETLYACTHHKLCHKIYRMAKANDFKFGMQLGFARAHHKLSPAGKVGVALD